MGIEIKDGKVYITTTDGVVHTCDEQLFKRWCDPNVVGEVTDDAPLNIDKFFVTLSDIEEDNYDLDWVEESYLELALALGSPSYTYHIIKNNVSWNVMSHRMILKILQSYPNYVYNKRLYYTACLDCNAVEYIETIMKDPREAIIMRSLWKVLKKWVDSSYTVIDPKDIRDQPGETAEHNQFFKSNYEAYYELNGRHPTFSELIDGCEYPKQENPKSLFKLVVSNNNIPYMIRKSTTLHYSAPAYIAFVSLHYY